MITSPASAKKNQSRLNATPALNSRLTRYFSISVGACALGSQESFADIVNINVGSGTGGFNINGVNGGIASGTFTRIDNFPTFENTNNLFLYNNYRGTTGLGGFSFATRQYLQLAVNNTSNAAQIKNFASSTSISSSSLFNSNYINTAFKSGSSTAANFTTNNYVGFRFGSGSTFNYGWLQTTWDGTNFQINSGAYESTVNTAILAGAAAPVPEPGTLTLGSLALLAGGGAAVRRYRKQRQSQSASTTNATDPVTPVA
jgi:hypothetical protein